MESAAPEVVVAERWWRIAMVGVFVATLVTFAAALDGGFVNYDDWPYVFDLRTLEGLTSRNVVRAFTEILAGNYHPLTWLSHMLDVEIFGTEPLGHHIGNIILHAINSVLILVLLRRMGATVWASTVLTLLFALHPLRAESVAWVSERKDVLCACFYLATLVLWTSSRRRLVPIVLMMALAFLSKPMAVSLPVIMALHDRLVLRRSWSLVARHTVVFFVLAGALAGATVYAQHRGIQPTELIPFSMRFQSATITPILYYLRNTVSPDCLHILYMYPDEWEAWKVVVSAMITAIFLGIAFHQRNKNPLVSLGILWFFISLLPVTGIIMVGIAVAADRYTYLPTVGLLVAAVPLVNAALAGRYRRVLIGGGGVVVVSFALLTQPQIATWRTTETLIDSALTCEPENPHLLEASASIDMEQGFMSAAVVKLDRAVVVRPGLITAWTSLALIATLRRDWPEAKRLWLEVLSWDAGLSVGHLGLSLALTGVGELDAAAGEFARADLNQPSEPRSLQILVASYMHMGLVERAEKIRLVLEREERASPSSSPSRYSAH